MEPIIGRSKEIKALKQYVASSRAEFIAIYGRRRVGKTFLVDQLFRGKYTFRMTGVIDGNLHDQITAFMDAADEYGLSIDNRPKDWMEAFIALKNALKSKLLSQEPCIIFIDELPAMDAQRANVAKAIGYFWNTWACLQDNLTLIICGSATSWMIDEVIDSHGGLHNRITHEMHIVPFTLAETKAYLDAYAFVWNNLMILQAYMIFGGIPYYLTLLNNSQSLVQNVDRLFFSTDDQMRREYNRLFKTLFRHPKVYLEIVHCLSKSRYGLTREQLSSVLHCSNNGHLGDKLQALVQCDIIREIKVREKKIKETECIYQLRDMFCQFYLNFLQRSQVQRDYWAHHINTSEVNSWLGLSYERVALEHTEQICKALRIDGISTLVYAWRSKQASPAAQIDLIIERADQVVNICEVKYSLLPYELDKDEYQRLQYRAACFSKETGLKHSTWLTMITTCGLKENTYQSMVQSAISLEDLFSL